MSKIIERIGRKIGDEKLIEKLTEKIKMDELHSLLLEVFRIKAQQRNYANILNEYSNNNFFEPSSVSVRKLYKLENFIVENIDKDIDIIEISPVAPLGTCSKIGIVNQNRVISTMRGN